MPAVLTWQAEPGGGRHGSGQGMWGKGKVSGGSGGVRRGDGKGKEENRAGVLAAALLRVEAQIGWVSGRWGEGSKKQGKSKADVGGSRGRKDAREPCAALIKLLHHDARNFMSALQVYLGT